MSGASTPEPKPESIGEAATLDVTDPRAPAPAPSGPGTTPPLSPPPAILSPRGAVSPGQSPGRVPLPDAPLRPGDALGRFVVRAELGRGGMGIVYAADDVTLGREVALKVLPLSDEEEPRRRFLREARSAAALTDPAIATVYDVGEDAGRVFIAMELVRGRTLRAVMDTRPPGDRALPSAEALRLAREVAKALGAAHARGVIHRDLKPENVMLTEGGAVKILDFGLAKRSDPTLSGTGTASTDDGRILGTPSYMSPEQTKGRGVDAQSDVFSLGVMMYEMVTGRRPFDRPSVVEMFVAIDRDEPPPPARQNPRVSPALERVILRCLRKDPAARYADARALLQDLASLDGAPPPAPPKRAGALLAIAAAFVAVLAAVALRSRSPAPASPAPATAEARGVAVSTPLTALPAPRAGKPEALTAYQQAMAGFRSGDEWGGGFFRAVELDPTLAAAHLRLAASAMADAAPSAREHFRRADELRASLDERDRALLDAVEPVVRRQPADWAEANRRLGALAERWPGDAEIWFYLALGTSNYADFAAGARCYEKAVTIDPGFSRAWAGMAMDQAYLGRFDEARRTIDRCLVENPTAYACLSQMGLLQSWLGDCEGMESTARRTIAAGVEPANAYRHLAQSLASLGQPISTVREALRQSEQALPPQLGSKAERERRVTAAQLAMLAGDFEAAEKEGRAYEKLIAESRRQDDHAAVALGLAQILAETGRDKEAGEVALDYLDRRDAWEPNPGAEDIAIGRDATPSLLVLAVRGGQIARADAAARRAAWTRAWAGRLTPVSRNFLWLYGWARAVDGAGDAREALAALPQHLPLPPFRPLSTVDLDVGRTFLLAGRADEAIDWLGRFARSCTALAFPMARTHAHYWLGLAREAKGDAPGACAAYQAVLDRWGKARPKSVTADAARDRLKALRCGT